MSAAVSVEVLAEGVPIDCGGMADSLAGCYGAVPAVGIAAAAVLGAAALAAYTAFAVFFPQVLNALMGIPATTDPMGRRSDWADARAHPQSPIRPPDSHLAGGDPVYHRPGATAIGYDESTLRNFDAVAPEPGHHDVVVHGERNGLFRPGVVGADGAAHPSNYTHPAQIAEAIRGNPHYGGGPVRLVSCHSGTVAPDAGVAPPAQQVADALGVTVMAPTDAVGVNRYGPAGQVPRIRNGGQWVTFYPGGGTDG